MNLVESMMEDCILYEKRRVPDGEGGFTTQWVDGSEFRAAITMDTTMQARIAQKDGMTSIFTVTTPRGVVLEFHDVFRRKLDGETFRVTSNGKDKQSPLVSSLNLAQVTAERWVLT